ncbi:MAG: aminoglycoside phosphotransferase family protein, partial [Chloroflexota bacterium]|nr:aminoglycoside phosphotransferase family protein [Chloroflexota bacterium]
MADIHSTVVWASDAWRLEAVAWIDLSLEAAGITRCGDVEQLRIRPWATVMIVPTCDGRLWFKAAAPETAFEVMLYSMLTELAPDAVLTPLAMDTDRSWLLMPDGGSHLDEVTRGDALVEALTVILPRYAELQRTMAQAAGTLIANGVADIRPAVMLSRFDEALRVTGDFDSRSGKPEHRAMWEQIADMRDTIAASCDHLAGA